jgi:polysaccharide export outer membrane protein
LGEQETLRSNLVQLIRDLSLILAFIVAIFPASGFAQGDEDGYLIKPGDVLGISVWGEAELQGTALVTPDGRFSFPLVGHLNARGKTAEQVQDSVRQRLLTYLSDPVVTVSLQEINGNTIYVLGQVNNPGEFVMRHGVDVMQALSMAGGTTAFASLNDIRILRRRESDQVALEFRYSDVIRGRRLEQNIRLQSGDVVVVP